MTEKKNTKRSLVWSGLALIICVSMLIGSTFAWFTDSASTGVNKIQSGNLDVALEMLTDDGWVSAEDQILNFVKAEGHEEEAILWEPGCTYSLPTLRVVNKGNLALKYKVVITGISGDAKLNEAIEWEIGAADGTEQHLLAGETSESFTISGHMKEDAGNEYMNLSIDGIAITVYATQDTVEFDSTTNQYDANATLPSVWDGTVGTLPEAVNGVLTINNASELAAFAQEVNRGLASTTYAGVTVNLTCDIDLAGHAWTPIGLEGSLHNNFQGTFDGNGHTIYNMTVSGVEPVGFFGFFTGTVKDLTFDNANVSGNHWGGVIAGYASYDNTVIENCIVNNSVVKLSFNTNKNDDGDKAGAITGYLNGNVTIKNNKVDNCQIYAVRDAGVLLGCNGTCSNTNCITGNTVKNSLVCTEMDYRAEIIGRVINGLVFDTTSNTAENVTVKSAKIVKTDDSATVINALKSNTEIIDITLTGDVEINGDSATQWTNAYGGNATQTVTIDGQGKYTLTIKHPDSDANHVATNGAELALKNLKLTNSGYNNGPWNRHDIVFDCKVTLENVVSDKAIALGSDASMKNVTIADRNTDSTYALWIQAKGQNVTLDNLTISNVGGDTRAIAIKDEYITSPASVNLTIKNSNIASNKKAAILVTSKAGATINASNVDISAVTADTTNIVWVDSNSAYKNIGDVTCTGGTVIVEP